MIYAVIDNRWKIDGFDESASLRVTFAEAKFNDVIERGGTLSNKISVKRTANNEIVLREISNPNSTAERARRIYSVQVYEDDLVIFIGSLVFEEVNKVSIDIRLFSSGVSFFSQISEKNLRDINLDEFNHEWTAPNVNSRRQNTFGVVYPNINYGRWVGFSTTRPHTDFFPAVYIKTVIEKGAEETGRTVSGLETYTKTLPFSRQVLSKRQQANLKASSLLFSLEQDAPDYPNENNVLFDEIKDPRLLTSTVSPLGFDYTNIEIQHPFEAELTLNVTHEGTIGNLYGCIIQIITDTAPTNFSPIVSSFLLPPNTPAGSFTQRIGFSYEDTNANLYVRVISVGRSIGEPNNPDDEITITNIELDVNASDVQIDDGDLIYISDTLPDITFIDLIKFVAAELNALVIVNESQVRFVKLDDIANNISNAYDWNKFLVNDEEVDYVFTDNNFGSENIFKYKQARAGMQESFADLDGKGVITSSDKTRTRVLVAYEAPFRYTVITQPAFSEMVWPFIKRYSTVSTPFNEPDIDPEPRVLEVRIDDVTLEGANFVDIDGEAVLDFQANGYETDFQDSINENYTTLSKIINDFRLLKTSLYIPREVILDIDFTRPVSLLGAYWYIRQVREYTINKRGETVVELIKLP